MNPTPPPNDKDFKFEPVHPDLLEFARQTFNMKEHLDGVKEIEEGKGFLLVDILAEIEEMVFSHESALA